MKTSMLLVMLTLSCVGQTLQESIEKLQLNAQAIEDVVNGPAVGDGSSVLLPNGGTQDTLAKMSLQFAADDYLNLTSVIELTANQKANLTAQWPEAVATVNFADLFPTFKTLNVRSEGNDANALSAVTIDPELNRSYPQAFSTITAAYNASRQGDTILIEKGDYEISLSLTGDRAGRMVFADGSTVAPLTRTGAVFNTISESDALLVEGNVSFLLKSGLLFNPTFASFLKVDVKNIFGGVNSNLFYSEVLNTSKLQISCSGDIEVGQFVRSWNNSIECSIDCDELIALRESFAPIDMLNADNSRFIVNARIIDAGEGEGSIVRMSGDNTYISLTAIESIESRKTWGSSPKGSFNISTAGLGDGNLGACEIHLSAPVLWLDGMHLCEVQPGDVKDSPIKFVIDCESIRWNKDFVQNRRMVFNFAAGAETVNFIFPQETMIKVIGDDGGDLFAGGGLTVTAPRGLISSHTVGVNLDYGVASVDPLLPDFEVLPQPIDVWWAWGQSNMWGAGSAVGYAFSLDGSESETPYRWSSGTPPTLGKSVFGPLVSRPNLTCAALLPLRDIAAASPRKFALIETSLGSTSLSDTRTSSNNWTFGSELYNSRISHFMRESMTQLATQGFRPRLRAMISFQGESDAGFTPQEDQWGFRHRKLIEQISGEFDSEGILSVVMKTHSTVTDNAAVNAGQQAFVNAWHSAAIVETSTLDRTDTGDIHLTYEGRAALSPLIQNAYNSLR